MFPPTHARTQDYVQAKDEYRKPKIGAWRYFTAECNSAIPADLQEHTHTHARACVRSRSTHAHTHTRMYGCVAVGGARVVGLRMAPPPPPSDAVGGASIVGLDMAPMVG